MAIKSSLTPCTAHARTAGPYTILKEDMFPGMRSNKITQLIDGAPNFRALPGFPIYGTGMPTLDGISAVLRWVSGSLSPGAGKRVAALWINMREEPVVYIKGVPFVLREEVRCCGRAVLAWRGEGLPCTGPATCLHRNCLMRRGTAGVGFCEAACGSVQCAEAAL